jgi:hypothetical protein
MNDADIAAELAASIPEFAVTEPRSPEDAIVRPSFTLGDAGYLEGLIRGAVGPMEIEYGEHGEPGHREHGDHREPGHGEHRAHGEPERRSP